MSVSAHAVPPDTATSTMAASKPRRARRAGAPQRTQVVLTTVSIVAGIGIWWLLALLGFRLPTPIEVVVRGGELLSDGTLIGDLGAPTTTPRTPSAPTARW